MNIKDIARLAKVSTSTVSKVINGKDDSISKETRERVLKIVRDYNYSPYSTQYREKKKSWTIGVLLNSKVSLDSTLDGILREAQKNNYSTLLLNSFNSNEQELKNITFLCKSEIDGIIWEPVSSDSLKQKYLLDDLNIPIQAIGEFGGDDSTLLPYKLASKMMTDKLIEKGHKNIICLSGYSRRRSSFILGYKESLFNNHLNFNDRFLFSEIDENLIHLIQTQQVSGIVTSHYMTAISIYTLINKTTIQVPENLSMISIKNDNDTTLYPEINIKISSIEIKNENFGMYICKKVIDKIEKNYHEVSIFETGLSFSTFATISKPFFLNSSKVTVVGSINIDTYLKTHEFPKVGTSTILKNVSTTPGGKGLNQAIGVSKLEHPVNLIGKVGGDLDSNKIYQELEKYGINTSGIIQSDTNHTGKAFIFLKSGGDSLISLLPGANNELSPNDLYMKKELFQDSKFCLLQSEIPFNTIEKACDLAHENGAETILRPATNKKIPLEILKKVDYFIPNREYFKELSRDNLQHEEEITLLINNGIKYVIVTLGSDGCYLKTSSISKFFAASNFTKVDGTGAGDAFISAFVSYLMYGYSTEKALEIANYAAGYSISRSGVISSLIDKENLDFYIQ